MACEILIHRNKNNYSHSNIEKDKRAVYKKGYIVMGKTLPHSGWGNQEQFSAGNFVILRITDAIWEEVRSYADHWRMLIDYTKIGEDLVVDGHRFRVYTTNPGVSGYGNLTLQKIENYLDDWNAIVFSNTTNEVVIDCVINDMLRSKSYWDYVPGDGIVDVQYSETSYDQGTGEHIYDLDYSNVRPEIVDRNEIYTRLERRLLLRNATISNHDSINQIMTVSIFRNDVLTYFRDEVYKDVANRFPLYRREYYIDSTDVDSLVTYSTNHSGEPYEVTKAEFLTYMKSQLDRSDA